MYIQSLIILVMVGIICADPYDDGKADGRWAAENKWIMDGNTCSDAWDFDADCKIAFIQGTYRESRRDNWEEKLYKEGARDGVLEVVEEYQASCLGQPDQCTELGQAAAGVIARAYCESAGRSKVDYEKACRDVAINECEGYMQDALWVACNASVDTMTLLGLQDECEDQVDGMLGYNLRH